MPSLKQLTCEIKWNSTRETIQEHGIVYSDGHVDCYLAIADNVAPFYIQLTSYGCIAPGLAMFVFIDGEYQCNRNRTNLRFPADSAAPELSEINFKVRQKESIDHNGVMWGQEWMFQKLKGTDVGDKAGPAAPFDGAYVGTIEIVVLRCAKPVEVPKSGNARGSTLRRNIIMEYLVPHGDPVNARGNNKAPLSFHDIWNDYGPAHRNASAYQNWGSTAHRESVRSTVGNPMQMTQQSLQEGAGFNKSYRSIDSRDATASLPCGEIPRTFGIGLGNYESVHKIHSRFPTDPMAERRRREISIENSRGHELGSTLKSYWADWKFPMIEMVHTAVSEEPYAIRQDIRDSNKISHQVQKGQYAPYYHRIGGAQYTDTFKKPYAVFAFHYRNASILEDILGRPVNQNSEPGDNRDRLRSMTQEELIDMLMELRVKTTVHEGVPADAKTAADINPVSGEVDQGKKNEETSWSGNNNDSPIPNNSQGGQGDIDQGNSSTYDAANLTQNSFGNRDKDSPSTRNGWDNHHVKQNEQNLSNKSEWNDENEHQNNEGDSWNKESGGNREQAQNTGSHEKWGNEQDTTYKQTENNAIPGSWNYGNENDNENSSDQDRNGNTWEHDKTAWGGDNHNSNQNDSPNTISDNNFAGWGGDNENDATDHKADNGNFHNSSEYHRSNHSMPQTSRGSLQQDSSRNLDNYKKSPSCNGNGPTEPHWNRSTDGKNSKTTVGKDMKEIRRSGGGDSHPRTQISNKGGSFRGSPRNNSDSNGWMIDGKDDFTERPKEDDASWNGNKKNGSCSRGGYSNDNRHGNRFSDNDYQKSSTSPQWENISSGSRHLSNYNGRCLERGSTDPSNCDPSLSGNNRYREQSDTRGTSDLQKRSDDQASNMSSHHSSRPSNNGDNETSKRSGKSTTDSQKGHGRPRANTRDNWNDNNYSFGSGGYHRDDDQKSKHESNAINNSNNNDVHGEVEW